MKQVTSGLASQLCPGSRGIRADGSSGDFSWYVWVFRHGGQPCFLNMVWTLFLSFPLYFPLPSLAAIVFIELKIFVECLLHTKLSEISKFSPYKSLQSHGGKTDKHEANCNTKLIFG